MTDANVYGPGVSWRDVRRWALGGLRLWMPAYLRDSERHHIDHGETSITVGRTPLPRTFRPAPDVRKWPEQDLPAIIIGSPGLTDEAPEKQADRTYLLTWIVAFSAVFHGRDESDAELGASVYELAIRKLVDQQAGAWADDPAYVGPPAQVSSVRLEDIGFDEIEASRSRSLVAATTTFSIVFRNASSSMGGPLTPPIDPVEDPGDWPEVLDTELDIEREAL